MKTPFHKATEAIEAIDKSVENLETKIECNSGAIKETTKIARQLLQKICQLTIEVKRSKAQCEIKDSYLTERYNLKNNENGEQTRYNEIVSEPPISFIVQYVTEETPCLENVLHKSENETENVEEVCTENTKQIYCRLKSNEEVDNESTEFHQDQDANIYIPETIDMIEKTEKEELHLEQNTSDTSADFLELSKRIPSELVSDHNRYNQNIADLPDYQSSTENTSSKDNLRSNSQNVFNEANDQSILSEIGKLGIVSREKLNDSCKANSKYSKKRVESHYCFPDGSYKLHEAEKAQGNDGTCYNNRSITAGLEKNVYKNGFNYKQKRCEISHDNRISFHTRQLCFPGENITTVGETSTEPNDQTPPNISFTESLDSMLAASLAERDDDSNNVEEDGIDMETDTLGFNPLTIGKPRTLQDWLSYSEQLKREATGKMQTGKIKRSRRGHDYVMVLDCSARMKGEKFKTMITAVTEYVNGIKMVSSFNAQLHDNIGLAVFGETSTLISAPTCDYEMLFKEIAKLRPRGDAPLVGGLLMGLAGVLGTMSETGMNGFTFQPFMIVFTDSQSGNTRTETSGYNQPFQYFSTGNRQSNDISVITQVADNDTRIYFVPVETNCRNQIMDLAVRESQGKVIKPNEMHRLVRMTQTLHAASDIASEVRFMRPQFTRKIVRQKVAQRTNAQIDLNEDCVDIAMTLADPMKGHYTETNCRTLSLGDRVRRGPHWIYKNQDSGLPGTVIGQHGFNSVYVEWDSGYINFYMFDENIKRYNVEKISEYRKVYDGIMAVGCRVERGNDWTYGDEDGGQGCQGTVIHLNENGSVIVRWDCRRVRLYKIGLDGLMEVQLCDASHSTLRYKRKRLNPEGIPDNGQRRNPDTINEDDKIRSRNNEMDANSDKYIIPLC